MPSFPITFTGAPERGSPSRRRAAVSIIDAPTASSQEIKTLSATVDQTSAIGKAMAQHGDALFKLGEQLSKVKQTNTGKVLANNYEKDLKEAIINAQTADDPVAAIDAATSKLMKGYQEQATKAGRTAASQFNLDSSQTNATVIPSAKLQAVRATQKAQEQVSTTVLEGMIRKVIEAPEGPLRAATVDDIEDYIEGQTPLQGKAWATSVTNAVAEQIRIGIPRADAFDLPYDMYVTRIRGGQHYDLSDEEAAKLMGFAAGLHNQEYNIEQQEEQAFEKGLRKVQDNNFLTLTSRINSAILLGNNSELTSMLRQAEAMAAPDQADILPSQAQAAQRLIMAALDSTGSEEDSVVTLAKLYTARDRGYLTTDMVVTELLRKNLKPSTAGQLVGDAINIKDENVYHRTDEYKIEKGAIRPEVFVRLPSSVQSLLEALPNGSQRFDALIGRIELNFNNKVRAFQLTNPSREALNQALPDLRRDTINEAAPYIAGFTQDFVAETDAGSVLHLWQTGQRDERWAIDQLLKLLHNDQVDLNTFPPEAQERLKPLINLERPGALSLDK